MLGMGNKIGGFKLFFFFQGQLRDGGKVFSVGLSSLWEPEHLTYYYARLERKQAYV